MNISSYYAYPGLIKRPPGRSIEAVTQSVCKWYGITMDRIKAKGRRAEICEARHVAMYLLRHRTRLTLQEIAVYFGGRDHTTAIHACSKIQDLMDVYPDFRKKIEGYIRSI